MTGEEIFCILLIFGGIIAGTRDPEIRDGQPERNFKRNCRFAFCFYRRSRAECRRSVVLGVIPGLACTVARPWWVPTPLPGSWRVSAGAMEKPGRLQVFSWAESSSPSRHRIQQPPGGYSRNWTCSPVFSGSSPPFHQKPQIIPGHAFGK